MKKLIIAMVLVMALTLATAVPAFAHIGFQTVTPPASGNGATIKLWLNSNDCGTAHTDGDGSLEVDVTSDGNVAVCVDAASN